MDRDRSLAHSEHILVLFFPFYRWKYWDLMKQNVLNTIFWNQTSWSLIFLSPIAHPTPFSFFFNWKDFPNYFAIHLFHLSLLFFLPFLWLSTTSSHFLLWCPGSDLWGKMWVCPRCLFFPCKSWCFCREACGHLGIFLKGIAFKWRWIVPSCATPWELEYFPHLSLLAEYLPPSEPESYFLYIHAKLRAQGFLDSLIAFETLCNGLQSILG